MKNQRQNNVALLIPVHGSVFVEHPVVVSNVAFKRDNGLKPINARGSTANSNAPKPRNFFEWQLLLSPRGPSCARESPSVFVQNDDARRVIKGDAMGYARETPLGPTAATIQERERQAGQATHAQGERLTTAGCGAGRVALGAA